MERRVLCFGSGRRGTAARKPSAGSVPGLAALLTSFRCLRPGSRTPPRPFSPPGQHSTAALFPWSRHKRRSRPGGCGRSVSRRQARPGRSQPRARFIARATGSPEGLKGRGAVAGAETGPIRTTEERGYPFSPRERVEELSRCLNWRLSSNGPCLIRSSPVLNRREEDRRDRSECSTSLVLGPVVYLLLRRAAVGAFIGDPLDLAHLAAVPAAPHQFAFTGRPVVTCSLEGPRCHPPG